MYLILVHEVCEPVEYHAEGAQQRGDLVADIMSGRVGSVGVE